jgi:hypothetical protein
MTAERAGEAEMAEDSVMYDSPTEFLHDAAASDGECVAQSVVPQPGGGFRCACSCDAWEIEASSRDEGLRLAREHTDSPRTTN